MRGCTQFRPEATDPCFLSRAIVFVCPQEKPPCHQEGVGRRARRAPRRRPPAAAAPPATAPSALQRFAPRRLRPRPRAARAGLLCCKGAELRSMTFRFRRVFRLSCIICAWPRRAPPGAGHHGAATDSTGPDWAPGADSAPANASAPPPAPPPRPVRLRRSFARVPVDPPHTRGPRLIGGWAPSRRPRGHSPARRRLEGAPARSRRTPGPASGAPAPRPHPVMPAAAPIQHQPCTMSPPKGRACTFFGQSVSPIWPFCPSALYHSRERSLLCRPLPRCAAPPRATAFTPSPAAGRRRRGPGGRPSVGTGRSGPRRAR